jgi:hypothetical protein
MKPGSSSWKEKQARWRRNSRPHTPAAPLLGPVPMKVFHASNCLCAECMTAGQHRADYDKAKFLQELL